MNKELLDKINAAVESDQIAFKQAAENLNLTLNEGAISGRRQGYFKGYSDANGEIETLKAENSKMRELIKAQDEYIELLGHEISDLFGIAKVHGWVSQRALQGQQMRVKITLLRTEALKTT